VGKHGTVLHYDGTSWSSIDSGTTEHLSSIWGSSASDVFIVGNSGTILHYPTPPAITTIEPNKAQQGQSLNVTMTGAYLSGASSVTFGAGITVNNFTVNNSTKITASISIDETAEPGLRDVFVTTPGGTDTLTNGFTVTAAPSPIITGVNPASGNQNETLDVVITGANFSGATSVGFSAGIIVNSFMVDSATQITANITISTVATLGARDISVTTLGGIATLADVFIITQAQAPPTITELDPNKAHQGQSLNVTIAGTCLTGASSVTFGAGITVNHFIVNNSTHITASISINETATPGVRDVSVTTLDGTHTLMNGFTVEEVLPSGSSFGWSWAVIVVGVIIVGLLIWRLWQRMVSAP
jgi:hypothetical protein